MSIGFALLLSFATLAQTPAGQQPKPAKAKLNAAVFYRQAIEELQRALPVPEYEGSIHLPDDLYEAGGPDYNSKAWREAVRKAAVAITLFEQASTIPTCNFDAKADGLMTEFISYAAHFSSLRHIVAAHAWQRLEKDSRGAAGTAMQLLGHAEHCSQQPFTIALAIGFETEQRATKLLQAAIEQLSKEEDGQVVAARFLKQLEQHLAARPTRTTIADISEREFSWFLENGLDEAAKNPAMKSACKRAAQIHRGIVLPLREDPTVSVQAMKEHTTKHVKQLKKLTKTKKVAAILENGVGETLAAAIVLICTIDTSRVLEPCLKAGKSLEACRVELHKLAGT